MSGCTHHRRQSVLRRTSGTSAPGAGATVSASSAVAVARHPRGGIARVGVWEEPDPGARTLGGAAVRALVLPQLFVAEPDGSWAAALAEPGSDRLAPDALSASFRMRAGARWSNGALITADDLRRSRDDRFVSGIEGPVADGTLTVRFTQRLPGWHRLWSGVDSVSAPIAGVWGGPFIVADRTPGLQVVLSRNDRWWGGTSGRPFLDELDLVLVPDSTTARQLLDRGALDVLMPPAATVRTAQLKALAGVHVDESEASGWGVGLVLAPEGLGKDQRRAVIGSVDRERFVGTLLKDEASVPAMWPASPPATDFSALSGKTVDLVGESEEPNTTLLQRAMQTRLRPSRGRLDLRNAEADRVEGWLAAGTYQAAIVMDFDSPDPCWSCRWGKVNAALAQQADAGDQAAVAALRAELVDKALFLPLWRPRAITAWRNGLNGVRANGFGLNAAWEAWEWWHAG